MSEPPTRILDYAHPRQPSRNVLTPVPLEANPRASVPLAIGVFFLPICVPLGLVAYLLGAGVDALVGQALSPPFAHAIGYIAAAACLAWPLVHGWSNGRKALAETRLTPARGREQAILGLLLCGVWIAVLVVLLILRIMAGFA